MILGEVSGAFGRRLLRIALMALPVLAPIAARAGEAADRFAVAPGGYTPMKPTPGKGMPVDGGLTFQTQYSPTGLEALWMHDNIVMTVLIATTLFVLALLIWVVVRYNARANPVPSKTSHNTLLEVVWTGIRC
jgi:cytochrome c oxidase subunit 2